MRNLSLFILLFIYCQLSFAVVIRHDVAPENYLVKQAPSYMVDMPHEGQGALIAPQWLLTVAHVIFYDYQGKTLTIAGKEYTIETVVIHPEYRKLTQSVLDKGTAATMAFQYANRDIALVKLATPVKHITPIAIYAKQDELAKVVTGFGRGATGNGQTGAVFDTKKQKVLRKLTNRIDEITDYWLAITFDNDDKALPLEGIDGSGDSGGPVIITDGQQSYLAGMFAWDHVKGPLSEFIPGLYGHKSYQVRVSSYADWISDTISTN